MIGQELAVMHGTASVHVKGYVKQRQREWAKVTRPTPTASGKANVSGWMQLAAMLPEAVQHGGERLVAV